MAERNSVPARAAQRMATHQMATQWWVLSHEYEKDVPSMAYHGGLAWQDVEHKWEGEPTDPEKLAALVATPCISGSAC